MKMNPILGLLKVDWNSPKLRAWDFGAAIAFILIGYAIESPLTLWGGVAGLVLAAINPMARMQKFFFGFRKSH